MSEAEVQRPYKVALNVAYIIDSLTFGGAERQFVELVRGVHRYTQAIDPNIYVFHRYMKGFYKNIEELGIPITIVPRERKYDVTLIPRLMHALKQHSIDLIHSFSVMAGLAACIAGKLLSIPVVASTIRNGIDTNFRTGLSIRCQALMACAFVSNSRAGFANRFKKGRHNFKVVYNGVDMARFSCDSEGIAAARKRFGLHRFRKLVVMSASLSKNKDHATFLEAIPSVLAEMPQIGFLCLGDGPERVSLENQAASLGISGSVVFTGYIDDVCSVLAQSSVGVLLSKSKRHKEGISNALLEAMGMGLPVIATADGGTLELIQAGVNGLLVPPGNTKAVVEAMTQLLKNDSLSNQIGESGRDVIRTRFSLHRYIKEYLDIYQHLLTRKVKAGFQCK
jgi:glycosyltransferase involved in cell wall biosynthesis